MLILRHSLTFILLLAAMAAGAQQTGGPTGTAQNEEQTPNRYAVEIILFTYDDSISAGTEVFVPETPPVTPLDSFTSSAPTGAGRQSDGPRATGPSGDDVPDAPDAPGPDDRFIIGSGADRMNGAAEGPMGEGGPREDVSQAIDLASPLELIVTGTSRIEYTPLPPEARTLTAAHETLLRLDAYDPVLWAGWTQIVLEEDQSPALDLRRLGNLPLGFDGELRLYLGRFVHLVVDVSLEETNPGSRGGPRPYESDGGDAARLGDRYARGAPPEIVYRISEDRIMRNGETRYFDHPRFGLIARLTLVKAPDPDDEDSRFLPDLLPGTVDPEPADDPGA